MMRIEVVPKDKIERDWAECESHIVAAVNFAPGIDDIDNIRDNLIKGVYWLLVARDDHFIDAAVVLGAAANVHLRQLHVLFVGGTDMHGWFEDMLETIESFAVHHNYSQIICTGRPGWQKLMTPFGYEFKTVTMTKEV